jgi:beta-xylosidase
MIAAGVVVGVAGMLAMAAPSTAAFAAPAPLTAPVYPGDFPDPWVLLVHGTYWAYATGTAGKNLQAMSSSDLANWSRPTDPLPVLPSWAVAGRTWAPGVLRRGSGYLMYYTVHDQQLNQQCISVAHSLSPGGPFTDTSPGPLICQSANGGSIDPNPYLDPASGHLYLLWKSDDNSLGAGHPTHIWGQQLAPDGRSLAAGTSPSLLLTESAAWQTPVVEGPAVALHGARYYLFYGANRFDSAQSGIGYATSRTLLGGYTNRSVTGPLLGTSGNVQGPQGPAVFVDSAGGTRMAFAAWTGAVGYPNGGVRSLWIGNLDFRGATPDLADSVGKGRRD